MEMKITVHKYLHKEADTISTIEKISEVIPMKWEFIIMSSRIKPCLLEQKLPIECDKYDHKDRYTNCEISGIKFVKDQ